MPTVLTLGVGVLGGLLGWVSRLPAGPLLGALTAVALVSLVRDERSEVGARFRLPSRILIGATLGSLATPALLETLGASVLWASALSVAVLAVALLLGLLFARMSGVDRRTALLGSCPGGIAEMVALAQDDSAAQAEVVLGMHLVRKVVVVAGAAVVVALL